MTIAKRHSRGACFSRHFFFGTHDSAQEGQLVEARPVPWRPDPSVWAQSVKWAIASMLAGGSSPFPEGKLVDFERANLPFERLARDAELGRRASWAGHTAFGFFKGGLDQFLLATGESGNGPRATIRGFCPLVREPRLIDGESLALDEDYRALDHVLQLPHVAGPVVGLQQLQRPLFDIANVFPQLFRVAID